MTNKKIVPALAGELLLVAPTSMFRPSNVSDGECWRVKGSDGLTYTYNEQGYLICGAVNSDGGICRKYTAQGDCHCHFHGGKSKSIFIQREYYQFSQTQVSELPEWTLT